MYHLYVKFKEVKHVKKPTGKWGFLGDGVGDKSIYGYKLVTSSK